MFDNRSILITGGTGSFGQHCVPILLSRYKPHRIIIYSRDEHKQFEMQQKFNSKEMRYFIGDVRDKDRLKLAMRGVDFIIHAAALKQVPTAEYNPMECIKTNVNGAQNVIAAALESQVEKVIALSTDKAANPINLYGASKLVSDKLFVAANNLTGGQCPFFSVVRYGNVIGSRGSVVPFFQNLINNNVPSLPITDKEMTRFWISLEQGVDLVIRSFERMQGGEIFVPKIPSIRIMDLVKAMTREMDTHVIGIRPGEKVHEALCPLDDAHLTLEFADHYVIKPTIIFNKLIDYSKNRLQEPGYGVDPKFEYTSNKNPHFLNVNEIQQLLKNCAYGYERESILSV